MRNLFIILFMLSSLSSALGSSEPPDYYLIVVDGKGSYSFLDPRTSRIKEANKEILKKIKMWAKSCGHCIVDLVYVRKIEGKKSFFFSRYQNRRRIRYRKKLASFSEVNHFRALLQTTGRHYFFYYGHRSATSSDAHKDFLRLSEVEGLFQKDISGQNRHYDFSVLSTCNSATPGFLYPFRSSTYTMASPFPVHLMYWDAPDEQIFSPRKNLDSIVESYLTNSFLRHATLLEIEVAIGVYPKESLSQLYQSVGARFVNQEDPDLIKEFEDCRRQNIQIDGVTLLNKEPNFGHPKYRAGLQLHCPK